MGARRRRGRAQALTAARAQIIVAQHSPPPSRSDDANPSRRVTRLYPALSAAERRVSCWHPPIGGWDAPAIAPVYSEQFRSPYKTPLAPLWQASRLMPSRGMELRNYLFYHPKIVAPCKTIRG